MSPCPSSNYEHCKNINKTTYQVLSKIHACSSFNVSGMLDYHVLYTSFPGSHSVLTSLYGLHYIQRQSLTALHWSYRLHTPDERTHNTGISILQKNPQFSSMNLDCKELLLKNPPLLHELQRRPLCTVQTMVFVWPGLSEELHALEMCTLPVSANHKPF